MATYTAIIEFDPVHRLYTGRVPGVAAALATAPTREVVKAELARSLAEWSRRRPRPDDTLPSFAGTEEIEVADEPAQEPRHVKPYWQQIVELGQDIPEEELARIPRDYARNLDHYLYGAPKEEE